MMDTLEDRLTQCQELIAELNMKMAMLMKERTDMDRRLRKLEQQMRVQSMTTPKGIWAQG